MVDTTASQSLVTQSPTISMSVDMASRTEPDLEQLTLEQVITGQFHAALDEHFYLGLLYQPVGPPIVELYDESSASIVQTVDNGTDEYLLTTTFEKYSDDAHLYLRIMHQPSAQSACLKLAQDEPVDTILRQIQTETAQLATAAAVWRDQQEKKRQVATWLQQSIYHWIETMAEWDRACLKLAQTVLYRDWVSHTLYRLSYGATRSPVDSQIHPLDDKTEETIKTIVTATEPDSNRISFLRISESGERTVQIILGGLFDYEPIIFDSRPQVNQLVPYHAIYSIGHHRVSLPPCRVETYQPPCVPPTPPSWQEHLLHDGFSTDVVDCLNAYLTGDSEEIRSIYGLVEMETSEFVVLNPGAVFDVSPSFVT